MKSYSQQFETNTLRFRVEELEGERDADRERFESALRGRDARISTLEAEIVLLQARATKQRPPKADGSNTPVGTVCRQCGGDGGGESCPRCGGNGFEPRE